MEDESLLKCVREREGVRRGEEGRKGKREREKIAFNEFIKVKLNCKNVWKIWHIKREIETIGK